MSNREQYPISTEEFESIIASYKGRLVVQKTGLSYGSMVFFKMGRQVGKKGEMFDITLWGDWWRLYKDEEEICNSENIDRNFAETELFNMMAGESFQGVKINNNVTLSFSREIAIKMQREAFEDISADDEFDDYFLFYIPDKRKSIITLANKTPPQFEIERDADNENPAV